MHIYKGTHKDIARLEYKISISVKQKNKLQMIIEDEALPSIPVQYTVLFYVLNFTQMLLYCMYSAATCLKFF